MNVEYKLITNKLDRYSSYLKALTWDTKNTYSIDKNIGIDWLIQIMIGAYADNNLVGLGCIRTYYDDMKKYAYLSNIVDNNYRRKGIADRLLIEMLKYCKEQNIITVRVNILKNNLSSISQIEKNNFNFVSFDDKTITFEKN